MGKLQVLVLNIDTDTKSIPFDEVVGIARVMRDANKSLAKELKGTVKEICGTAFS